MILVYMCML